MNFNKIFSVILVVVLSILSMAFGATHGLDGEDARLKREHGYGSTGPVHTFVKTDKHAHFKWGVRHHVGHQYAGRR